jgi:adenylyltransferase/sulfurtransferase
MSRFDRQLILPGFGAEGQKKLSQSRVVVVGAGGLGCPVLLYLAAAGVGVIGIADGDSVALSNLNRQILFGLDDIGEKKVAIAAARLSTQYPDVKIETWPVFLTVENALEILSRYDLVVDGSDNFATRYLVNDACRLLNKPLVLGAVFQHEGQVAVFHAGSNAVSYRDLYPVPPTGREVPNCNEAGVLGVLPGIVGTMQAAEAIKLIAGLGQTIANRLLIFNLRSSDWFAVEITPHPDAKSMHPQNEAAFKAMQYNVVCTATSVISWETARIRLAKNPEAFVVDIRELDEDPFWEDSRCLRIPLSIIQQNPKVLNPDLELLFCCRSGLRSLHLTRMLEAREQFGNIYSIEGGLLHPHSPINLHVND